MKLRDLLELCRISNLPTVWSNAVMGCAAGAFVNAYYLSDTNPAQEIKRDFPILAAFTLLPLISISCLYCAGMALNDYWDRDADAVERPRRPIPSGRIQPHQARTFAIALFAAGMAFPIIHAIGSMAITGPDIDTSYRLQHALPSLISTVLLVSCIIAYNRFHTKSAVTVVLMACCRLFAILTAATLFAPWPISDITFLYIAGPALTIGCYTILISLVARREMEADRFAGPKTVMNMIAAMPLLDAVWLVVMGLWPASLFCVGCAVLTKLGHRKVAGS